MRGNEAANQKDETLGNRKRLVSAGSDCPQEEKTKHSSLLAAFWVVFSLYLSWAWKESDRLGGKSSDPVSFLLQC